MTTERVQRRSQRIQEINSSQPVVYDASIDNSDYEEDNEEDNEDQYEVNNKRKRKSTKQGANTPKKAKSAGTAEGYIEQRDNFEEHYLFQALNDEEVSVFELANDWVEQYKSNKDLAKKDLINLILNAVGCFTTIEEHDVSNNESASETVGEIQTFFKRQKVHEFYLLSKKQEYKHLKRNYGEFITQIINVSDEKGILYENIVLNEDEDEEDEAEDSNIMEDLLVWLSSFSVSSFRSLRYISTLSLLTIETTLCKAIKKNNTSVENFKHQLDTEKKKKATAAIKKRIAQTEENLETFTNQSTILESFIKDIVNTTFIHRFKDTDPLIRVEAMSFLGQWMDTYPELFFKVTYLKYLGWVLSDVNASVRLQVVKTLIKLLKQNVIVSGLRQFFERFKERIVEISFHDIDQHVRTNSIVLLSEVYKLGFLEDEEVSKVASLIFTVVDKKATSLVANFIQKVEAEQSKETIDSLQAHIVSAQDSFPIDIKDAIRIHTLIKILNEAHAAIDGEADVPLKIKTLEPPRFALAAKVLFSLSSYSSLWESLFKYILIDFSAIEGLDKELSQALELEEVEEITLLRFIYGIVLDIKDANPSKQTQARKEQDDNTTQKIISYFTSILKKVESSEVNLSIFIQIFSSFPISVYESTDQTDVFKTVYLTFLKFIRNNSIVLLKDEYILLLKNLASAEESTVIQEIFNKFHSFISELFLELRNYLEDPDFIQSPNFEHLYENYTFKLLVLGIAFDISEVYSTFSLFKEAVILTAIELEIEESEVAYVSSVFKILLSGTSRKLNNLLKTSEALDLEKELKIVPEILDSLYDYLNRESLLLSLRSEVSITLIDLLTILKNFFEEYEKSSRSNLSNVNRFKEIDLSSLKLSKTDNESFLHIFLSKEAIFANAIDAVLDREDDEDVKFNSLKQINDDEELDELKRWELEKGLAVYTAKLLGFHNNGFLNEKIVKRISLNSDELGELFSSIVEDGVEDEIEDDDEVIAPAEPTQDEIVEDDDVPIIEMED